MAVRMDAAGRYIDWGVVQISLTNLLIILAMIALFIAAVLVPFPGSHDDDPGPTDPADGIEPAAKPVADHTAGHRS